MNDTRARLTLPLSVVATIAVLAALGGGATAAKLVTGKDIKNSSITGKDIKDGSLKVKEVRKAELRKLQGEDGEDGTDGHSSFEPLPSGTTVRGGGILSEYAHVDDVDVRSFVSLPVVTTNPLNHGVSGRNMYSAPSTAISSGFESGTLCAGGYTNPTAAPGVLCLYPLGGEANVAANSGTLVAGVFTSNDGADDNGFYLEVTSAGSGEMLLRYVWAYTAP